MYEAWVGSGEGRARRVKVLATLGPASATLSAVCELAEAGADAFRLNTSHLAPAQVAPLVGLVRQAEAKLGRPLGVLVDLAGPKLRVGKGQQLLTLSEGAVVALGGEGSGASVLVEGADLSAACQVGSRVLLHDGRVVLAVRSCGVGLVQAEVLQGGAVTPGMGVNLPDAETSLPALTPRDLACLAAAIAAETEVVALSFVRQASDVGELQARLETAGWRAAVVAKLEKRQAVAPPVLEAILAVSDAVLVARGDLGAETSPEAVPVLQKGILAAARAAGVPAIVATELLESMREGTRPTRAEADDVANAVFDGADALLLTAETAIGAHPALAVATAARIAGEAERFPQYRASWSAESDTLTGGDALPGAAAAGAVRIAEQLAADAIVCFTASGRTARLVARYRPTRPVLALTPHPRVARALTMVWGVEPQLCSEYPAEHEAVVALAARYAAARGLVGGGGTLVVTHGAPGGSGAPTNLVRIHRVGAMQP